MKAGTTDHRLAHGRGAALLCAVLAAASLAALPFARAQAADRIGGFSTWSGAGSSSSSSSSSNGSSGSTDPDCAKRSKSERRWRDRKLACYASTIVAPGEREGYGVYHTIGKALAHTRPGGTVLVRPGQYQESVRITWPVDLRADVRTGSFAFSDRVVLTPPGNAPCMIVDVKSSEEVSVRDFWMVQDPTSRAEACIEHNGGSMILETSRIEGNGRSKGILLRGHHAEIFDNEIVETGDAIMVARSAFGQGRDRGHKIERNLITRNQIGVSVDADDLEVTLANNRISSNADAGLVISKGLVTADRNDVSRNARDGIVVVFPERLTMTGNTLIGNGGVGLHMPFSQRVFLSQNIVECNVSGGISPPEDDAAANEAFPNNQIRFNGEDAEPGFWRRVFKDSRRTRSTRSDYCAEAAAPPQDDQLEPALEPSEAQAFTDASPIETKRLPLRRVRYNR